MTANADRTVSGGHLSSERPSELLAGHRIGVAPVYPDKDDVRELRPSPDPARNLRTRLALGERQWAWLDGDTYRVVDASLAFASAGTAAQVSDARKCTDAEER